MSGNFVAPSTPTQPSQESGISPCEQTQSHNKGSKSGLAITSHLRGIAKSAFGLVERLWNRPVELSRDDAKDVSKMTVNPFESMTIKDVAGKAKFYAADFLDLYSDAGVFPIDILDIAQRLQIEVKFVDIPGQLVGLIVKSKDDISPSIYIDDKCKAPRKRFTIAHELGHYVQHVYIEKGGPGDAFGFNDSPETIPAFLGGRQLPIASNEQELFADKFAHNLLMPEEEVRECANLNMSLNNLAEYFWVSPKTMSNRLNDLGLSKKVKA